MINENYGDAVTVKIMDSIDKMNSNMNTIKDDLNKIKTEVEILKTKHDHSLEKQDQLMTKVVRLSEATKTHNEKLIKIEQQKNITSKAMSWFYKFGIPVALALIAAGDFIYSLKNVLKH